MRLLRGNKAGQAQALELAAIPLAVRLMREAASYAVAAGAADLLALLANGGTAAQGEAASEGGLAALMEWLEPYAGGSSVSPAALKLMSLSLSSTAAAAEPAAMSAAAACVACLHTLGCVVADNTFTKNMARQLGAFSTLGAILRRNSGALSASMAAVGAGAGGSLAPAQRDAALQLQVLTGAVLAVADLAHSNHANQVGAGFTDQREQQRQRVLCSHVRRLLHRNRPAEYFISRGLRWQLGAAAFGWAVLPAAGMHPTVRCV